MKITAFNGSPRGEKGNTAAIAGEFLKGAAEEGAEVEQIFLVEKEIQHCRGCFSCWVGTPGRCVIGDDVQELHSKVMESDVIVLATPLYVDDVTGIMKDFMDRIIPLVDPRFEKDPDGQWRHVKRFERYPEIVVVSNSGMPGMENFQVLKLHFRRMARNFHSRVAAEIYMEMGELMRHGNVLLKPLLASYRKSLRKAGKEFVREGAISEGTQQKLDTPLIKDEMYIQQANRNWDSRLKELSAH